MRTGRHVIAFLLACAGEPPAEEPTARADTGVAVDPTPWDYEGEADTPDHTLAQIQDGLTAGVSALQKLDAAVLYEGYADALTHGTPECPAVYPAVGVTLAWSNECTSRDGWTFSGRAQAAWFANTNIEGEAYAPYGEFIATATITDPTGATLDLDGRGTHLGWTEGSAARMSSTLLGTFAFAGTGDTSWIAPGWLDGGPSVSFTIERTEDGATRTVALEGGEAAPLADGIVGVRAEGLTITTDGTCTASGALVLSGDEGQRYRVEIPAGSGCAPCLDATRDDRALGEVCLDLADFVAWTERPW